MQMFCQFIDAFYALVDAEKKPQNLRSCQEHTVVGDT